MIAALGIGLTLGVTSCTATPVVPSDPAGTTPTSRTTAAGAAPSSDRAEDGTSAVPSPATAPAPPEGDAPRIARAVESELTALADSGEAVTSDRVRTAIGEGFAAAGASPASVEVSVDTTPTGLDVDAIQGAGLIDATCIFGEVREGSVTVAVLPALASGLCFVGDQR